MSNLDGPGEQIGWVQRQVTNWKAFCHIRACQWTLEKRTQEEASASLQSHASLVHPPLIPVYRQAAPLRRDQPQ